jgi:hypothetical protein
MRQGTTSSFGFAFEFSSCHYELGAEKVDNGRNRLCEDLKIRAL